jgi:hypothetical protein
MCGTPGDIFPVKQDSSHLRPIKSGDAVEETGFSGPVRADDREKFTRPNG